MDAGNRNSVVASLRRKELQERTFRARAGAAPLKHVSGHCHCAEQDNIPRPRGRGPVEACLPVQAAIQSLAIPRPRGRGPVEAIYIIVYQIQ